MRLSYNITTQPPFKVAKDFVHSHSHMDVHRLRILRGTASNPPYCSLCRRDDLEVARIDSILKYNLVGFSLIIELSSVQPFDHFQVGTSVNASTKYRF